MIDAITCTAGFGAGFLFGLALGCIATALAIFAIIAANDKRHGRI